jgi:hypothetical protein
MMAAAVGASHAALSRVLNSGQMPSAQMIEGLARSGRIDLNWLLLGEGGDEPTTRDRAVRVFLPVGDHLLAGPPSGCPEVFGPLGLPTASPFLVRDGYWFRVPKDSPLVARKTEAVVPGDHLLIEAGPAWTAREEGYVGRLVVLRHPDRAEGLLARVGYEYPFADEFSYELDTFGEVPDAFLHTRSRRADAGPPPGSDHPFAVGRPFHADDVVGVVLEKRSFYTRQG